jgi:hypothetical protein
VPPSVGTPPGLLLGDGLSGTHPLSRAAGAGNRYARFTSSNMDAPNLAIMIDLAQDRLGTPKRKRTRKGDDFS